MSWSFVDLERRIEVSVKITEVEGLMKMMTILGSDYANLDSPLSSIEFDDIGYANSRRASLSYDTDSGNTIEITTIVFEYRDRKGIGVKMVCYNRDQNRASMRRYSSDDSIRAIERELDIRALNRREENERIRELEASYLETRRRSRERRVEERRRRENRNVEQDNLLGDSTVDTSEAGSVQEVNQSRQGRASS